MFKNYQEYVAAATALLQDKPKGTGFANGTGVVLLVSGELCYVEDGDKLDDCNQFDASCWDDCTNEAETAAVRNPVFVARFTPAEVAAHEAEEDEPAPDRILNKTQAEAVYSAMCALNNANALLSTFIRTDSGKFIEVHDNGDEITLWATEIELPSKETHASQSAFATAYGLSQP